MITKTISVLIKRHLINYLLEKTKPLLTRTDTVMRKSLPVNERLALTLRYLTIGRNFEDMKYSAIMLPASISAAIFEICEVLIYVLQKYMKVSVYSSYNLL